MTTDIKHLLLWLQIGSFDYWEFSVFFMAVNKKGIANRDGHQKFDNEKIKSTLGLPLSKSKKIK